MTNCRLSRTAGVALALLSAACLLVVVTMTVWAGAITPGYSHASQFISELGATGSPTEMPVRWAGFLPAGVLLLAFCFGAFKALPRSRSALFGFIGLAIYAAGYLAAGVFPCDAGCRPAHPSVSQVIHNVVGLAGYFFAPAFLFLLTRAVGSVLNDRFLTFAGYLASLVALGALVTLSPESEFVGLSQRAMELSVLGWVTLLGIRLAQRSAEAR